MFKTHSIFSVMDELFESAHPQSVHAKAELKKTEKGILVDVLLPGFNKDEIVVKVENKHLIIDAETDRQLPSYLNNRVRRTYLVENIDADSIKAKLENGILNVEFSTAKKEAGKTITVE